MPRADGLGRVPAVEVMIATPFIRDCIVDKDRTNHIHGAIASGTSQYGMQTFDQSIFSLYQQGFVTLDEALRWASNVDEFKLKVQGISTTAELARDEMAKTGRRRSRTSSGLAAETRRSAYLDALHLLSRRGADSSPSAATACSHREHPADTVDAAIAHLARDRRPRRQAPGAGACAHGRRDQGTRTPARDPRAPGARRRQGGRRRSRRRRLRRDGRTRARRPRAAEEAAHAAHDPPTPPSTRGSIST